MNERLSYLNTPAFELRPEYNVDAARHFIEPAFEAIEDLIEWAGLEPGVVTHVADVDYTRQHLLMYAADESAREDDEILYSDLSQVRIMRAASVHETEAVLEEYRAGPLRRMAKLTLREFIGDSTYPIVNEYCIEQFAGGGMQALFSATDCVRGEGLDERVMALYDFKNLLHAAEARSLLLLGEVSANRS